MNYAQIRGEIYSGLFLCGTFDAIRERRDRSRQPWHKFKRRKETKVGAAAMKVGIAVLALSLLCGDAIAAPTQYAVDGLAIGTHLNFDSAFYREYKCSRSNQFDGLTWCQKTRSDRERRGSYTAAYSLLHSRRPRGLQFPSLCWPTIITRSNAATSKRFGSPGQRHRCILPPAATRRKAT
jgi:hypothetical protein